MNDVPLIPTKNRLIKIQGLYPEEPIIERALFYAKTHHEFAGALLALWEHEGYSGRVVPANEFQRIGCAIAEEIRGEMKRQRKIRPVKIAQEIREMAKVQFRLTTSAYNDGRGGSRFLECEPSDEARRQAVEHRNRLGSTYVRPKAVRKREQTRLGDEKWPLHWK